MATRQKYRTILKSSSSVLSLRAVVLSHLKQLRENLRNLRKPFWYYSTPLRLGYWESTFSPIRPLLLRGNPENSNR